MTSPETITHFTPSRRSRARSRSGSDGRPGPGSSSLTTRGRPVSGSVEGSAAIRSPAATLAATHASARSRVSVRVSSRASDTLHASGSASATSANGTAQPDAPGEDGQDGDEREDVALEVGLLRHQRQPVGEREREQDQVGLRAADQGRDDADRRHDQHRADRIPEPVEVGERGDRIVLEPEPAGPGEALHAGDVVPGRARVDQHERARESEPGDRERSRATERLPPPPPRHDHGYGRDRARILGRGGEADGEPGPLDAAADGERENARDGERQQHVRDGHPRVRDVGRRDGDRCCADDRRAGAVRAAAEPPRCADPAEPERDGDEAGSEERRAAEQRLHGREHGHQQGRVVVPAGIEVPVPHAPRARNDVGLVRIQNRERQPVAHADESERGGEHEDRREGDPASRPPEACHRRATPRRCRRR